ncbi:MAG: PAS domain-containing protein, partial [Candidatus Omnitrophica bacterium]|nr:PAS domain-containing protein [Candidatus Omnitrophota bacterium]
IHAKEGEGGCGGTAECKECPVRNTAKMILTTGKSVRGAEVSRTIRLATGEHKLVWLEINASPLEIKGERHILFSLQNITERINIDIEKRENLRFLQNLMDAMPNPVFYKDRQGVYLGCNKAFIAAVGKDYTDIIGKTVFDMAPQDLAEAYHAKDLELINNPGVQVYEAKVRFADGTLRDISFNKASFLGLDGKVSGLVGVMIDITERQKREDEDQKRKRELEVFYKASVGREERIIDLKKEVEKLKRELGR